MALCGGGRPSGVLPLGRASLLAGTPSQEPLLLARYGWYARRLGRSGCVPCNSTRKLHGEPVGCQARRRLGQGSQSNPGVIPVTTGSRGLEAAGAALRRMLGDKPASPVLGC